MIIRQPLLSPIRFHDPSLEFDNETTFQNPDNRLSTGYDWENVKAVPYALPIPKQWPDGQPGIDFILNTDNGIGTIEFYAHLYDEDDNYYKALYVDDWEPLDSGYQFHIWLDGLSGTGIEDGYYTVKIFRTSDDELLLESEALLIADWFIDAIPFEYLNFETDFGIAWDQGRRWFTGRLMAPIRMFDPSPTFEKEMYRNDPGVLTTLRSVPQRVFNFDTHPLPVHIIELIQMAFSCSLLYLDRIQINAEDTPEAELYEGTNLKYLTGKATLVNFNDEFIREVVETTREDQSVDWNTHNYVTAVITGNSIAVNDPVIGSTYLEVETAAISHSDKEILLFKITIVDDAGDSDLPTYVFGTEVVQLKEWGINWICIRCSNTIDSSHKFYLRHYQNQKAVYTGEIEVYKNV